jgi:UDP-galactopyranose mutase
MHLVVGCGLSGVTIAQQIAERLGERVLIIEKRDHIGGNCYDYVDEPTGVLLNKYGPHYFHTNDEGVWEYVRRFATWERYENVVLSRVDSKLVPVPVNITTVNKLCGENIQTEAEMDQWLAENQVRYDVVRNGAEMAKSRVGEVLYEKLFRGYTFKQWGVYPEALAPEVLARIPVRNSQDTRYFSDKYQALPVGGYTKMFERMLANSLIEVRLGVDYFEFMEQEGVGGGVGDEDRGRDGVGASRRFDSVVYTGPIDRYFSALGHEPLEYRSLRFVYERHFGMNYYQPVGQVNYPGPEEEFTRITEYKHCLDQVSPHTIISKEYSCAEGEPYYPVLNDRNLALYETYRGMAEGLRGEGIHFVGRLANYKYFNMDQAIRNALDYFEAHLSRGRTGSTPGCGPQVQDSVAAQKRRVPPTPGRK